MSGNKFNKLPEVQPIIINKPIEGNKTIVVIGIGRSCTSLTAAVIDGLGVNMDGSYDGHFERLHFKDGDWTKETIKDLNDTYNNWGVQLMAVKIEIDLLLKQFRNPHLILVFRDIIANSQRLISSKDLNESAFFTMKHLIKEQNLLLHTAIGQYPILYLSCERIRYEPKLIIDHLCDFIQIKGNKQKALDRIGNGYLIQ